MESLEQIKNDIFTALKADFEANHVPAILRRAKEEGIPTDILTTLHRNFGGNADEVMGEFYFLPIPGGEKEVLYFSTMLSLDENMKPEYADDVGKAIEVLNFYLECGAFVMNRKSGLIGFRFVTPVFAHWRLEQMLETVNLNVAHSLQITERYVDSLIMMAHGHETLEHFMQLMPE